MPSETSKVFVNLGAMFYWSKAIMSYAQVIQGDLYICCSLQVKVDYRKLTEIVYFCRTMLRIQQGRLSFCCQVKINFAQLKAEWAAHIFINDIKTPYLAIKLLTSHHCWELKFLGGLLHCRKVLNDFIGLRQMNDTGIQRNSYC